MESRGTGGTTSESAGLTCRPRVAAALLVGVASAALAARTILYGTPQTGAGAPKRLRPAVGSTIYNAFAPSPFRVLVAHEQHLQRVGSDTRLLALLTKLRDLGTEISLLVRTSRCNNCTHSPPIPELAHMLRARLTTATRLSRGLAPHPPAIYEYGGTIALATLLATHHFDLVLVGLWFWYDPQPSFAEILLPLLRAHSAATAADSTGDSDIRKAAGAASVVGGVSVSPPHAYEYGRPHVVPPLVALLSDDAHAERARRLAQEETDAARARAYRTQAVNLAARQRALFAAADAVFYLTRMDRDADRPLWPQRRSRHTGALGTSLHVGMLRMGVAPRPQTSPWLCCGRMRIGFVGDGHTATNALGVRRFIRDGWPLLRRAHPGVRLRIVGRVPSGHRAGRQERRGGKDAPCNASTEAECGWAMGTRCALRPARCGIDTLGFLSDEELLTEVASWRLMVAPIFATTGANTKLLLGLQLGLPLVSTRAAAAPFGLDPTSAGEETEGEDDDEASFSGDEYADGDDGSELHPRVVTGGGEDGTDDGAATISPAAAAAVGTTPQHLARLAATLLTDRRAAARVAANGRAHLQRLASSKAPAEDVRAMLRWVAASNRAQGAESAPASDEPMSSDDDAGGAAAGDNADGDSAGSTAGGTAVCAAPGATRTGLLVSSTCGVTAMWSSSWRVNSIWEAFCRHCGVTCVRSMSSARDAAGRGVVLLDESCRHRPRQTPLGARLPQVFVHFAWDPTNVRQLYHRHGGLLHHTLKSETLAAQVRRPCIQRRGAGRNGGDHSWRLDESEALLWCDGALTARIDRLGGAAAWRATWTAAFAMALGVSPPLPPVDGHTTNATARAMLAQLVKTVAEPHRSEFARELRAHVKRPRWPLLQRALSNASRAA